MRSPASISDGNPEETTLGAWSAAFCRNCQLYTFMKQILQKVPEIHYLPLHHTIDAIHQIRDGKR